MTAPQSTRRVRLIKKPNNADLVVLVSGKLLGRERRIGDPIPLAEWEGISPRMRATLLSVGRVGPRSAFNETPVEAKASKGVSQAQEKLKEAERVLNKLQERAEKLDSDLARLEKEREAVALDALNGDVDAGVRLQAKRDLTVATQIELSDVESALKEAEKKVIAAQRALAVADSGRHEAEALRLIETQGKTCQEIQKLIEGQLRPLIEAYEKTQRQYAAAVPMNSVQVISGWRLESVLRKASGLPDTLRGSFKFENLKELEQKIMRDALMRWRAQRTKDEERENAKSS